MKNMNLTKEWSMLAVIEGNWLHYIGEDKAKALTIFESKPNSKMVNINSLMELQAELETEKADVSPCDHQSISETLRKVLDKLDENGFNTENVEELQRKLKTSGEKLTADVKSLGIRSMRVVGDGLTTLGDFLRQTSEEEESVKQMDEFENEGGCCGGDTCNK